MIQEMYDLWKEKATADPDLVRELNTIAGDDEAISDRFYKNLEFGTGGLRGEIGAGTNRMNIYTVGKATQGLAEYILSVQKDGGKAAIAYDSRIKSDLFAKVAASVLAANGIHVYIYPELMPTPMLSYAVRYYHCDAGIVITASHNPAKYNGYKAYGSDGCQLNLEASKTVLSIMNQVDIFNGVRTMDFDEAVQKGLVTYIPQETIDSYLTCVQSRSVSCGCDLSNLKVVYTPLHGTGNKPVRSILKRIGVGSVTVVPEQELPNGHFPTAPYPNPEIAQAFECALKLADQVHPDLLLATDPDCDRVGIAVLHEGEYKLMSGNDVGALLLDFVLKRRTADGTLPKNPIAVKTIVTSDLCQKICDHYHCQLINVLTGFKFIGEQIGLLEKKGEENRFVFGFEESYGYLSGGYVRDKDAVVASMLICEMVAFYKQQGLDLTQVLGGLYQEYGYYFCSQKSFTFEGESGMNHIAAVMNRLRNDGPKEICGHRVLAVRDYLAGKVTDLATQNTQPISLPQSNVLCFVLDNTSTLTVRPSGTEPKIKFYISAVASSESACRAHQKELESTCENLLKL